jgi:hypothetical protein
MHPSSAVAQNNNQKQKHGATDANPEKTRIRVRKRKARSEPAHASCHYCKQSFPYQELNCCQNESLMSAKLPRPTRCRKKFCFVCLKKYFS